MDLGLLVNQYLRFCIMYPYFASVEQANYILYVKQLLRRLVHENRANRSLLWTFFFLSMKSDGEFKGREAYLADIFRKRNVFAFPYLPWQYSIKMQACEMFRYFKNHLPFRLNNDIYLNVIQTWRQPNFEYNYRTSWCLRWGRFQGPLILVTG